MSKYRTTTFSVVLYGCETWSFTLRKNVCWECSRIGSNTDKVTGEWKERKEELHELHSSPNCIQVVKSRRLSWVGSVASVGRRRSEYRSLMGEMWERDNLADLGLDGRISKWVFRKQKGGRTWICLAQDRQNWRAPANTWMDVRLPWNAEDFLNS
jgi:hypothetical protein